MTDQLQGKSTTKDPMMRVIAEGGALTLLDELEEIAQADEGGLPHGVEYVEREFVGGHDETFIRHRVQIHWREDHFSYLATDGWGNLESSTRDRVLERLTEVSLRLVKEQGSERVA